MKNVSGIMPINKTVPSISKQNKIRWLKYLSYSLFVFIFSITIVTKTFAESENILAKSWHKITTNQKDRQIIRLSDEKSGHISAVAWSPDGKSIATAGRSMQVTIWDSATLSIRHKLDQGVKGNGFDNIAFSPDSQYVASGLSTVNVWKVAEGTLQTTLIAPHITPGTPQPIGIKSLRFSPDGKMLVVAYSGEKQIVIAYRVADGKIVWTYLPKLNLEPKRIKDSSYLTTPLYFTPDGKRVVLGTVDYIGRDVNLRQLSKVLLLDAKSGEYLRSIDDVHTEQPTALTLSPDGKWVATGTGTGNKHSTFDRKTNKWVNIVNKDPVRIWNLETGKLVKELPVTSGLMCLAFSRNGKYLFGAKSDFNTHLTLAVWDVASGKMVQEVRSNPAPMGLAVSPDGKRLAAACQGQLSIYEITTNK